MLRIDKAIFDTNDVICNNIAHFSASDRGLLSQNILGQIRNFVEYIAIKAYSNGQDINPNDYDLNVITNETEERITHNIFYTAITRAKNNLKIYWSPETEQSVLERLEIKNCNKDAHLLSQLSSLTITK